MEIKDLEKFDPSVAELNKMVEATKGITATDLKDKSQLAIVKENRISLKKARVQISKIGKELRQDAIDFQSKVIAKEKELIAIIEPEENRLEAIEEEAEQLKIKEERLEKLPARKARLEELTIQGRLINNVTDEFLLSMDSESFEAFYNSVVAERNEIIRVQQQEEQDKKDAKIKADQALEQQKLDAQKAELDKKEADLKAKEDEIKRAEQIKQAEEKAREDERIRIAKEEKEKQDKITEDFNRQEKEKKEKQALLIKQKKYMDFLKSHGWTKETKDEFKVEESDGSYILYKKLGTFKN